MSDSILWHWPVHAVLTACALIMPAATFAQAVPAREAQGAAATAGVAAAQPPLLPLFTQGDELQTAIVTTLSFVSRQPRVCEAAMMLMANRSDLAFGEPDELGGENPCRLTIEDRTRGFHRGQSETTLANRPVIDLQSDLPSIAASSLQSR